MKTKRDVVALWFAAGCVNGSLMMAAAALAERQTPLIAKQPAPRLIPLPLKVEVAPLAILSAPLIVVDAPTKRLPPMYPLPVVVAPPLMVRPPFCAPLPIVEEPSRMAKLPVPPLIPPVRLKLLIVPALMVLAFSVVEVAVPKYPVPETVTAVLDANGRMDALVPVEMNERAVGVDVATTFPFTSVERRALVSEVK